MYESFDCLVENDHDFSYTACRHHSGSNRHGQRSEGRGPPREMSALHLGPTHPPGLGPAQTHRFRDQGSVSSGQHHRAPRGLGIGGYKRH